MKENKGFLKKVWNKLKTIQVKKRNLGILAIVALRIVTTAKPELIPESLEESIRWGIDGLLFGGAAHSVSKTDTAKGIGKLIFKK